MRLGEPVSLTVSIADSGSVRLRIQPSAVSADGVAIDYDEANAVMLPRGAPRAVALRVQAGAADYDGRHLGEVTVSQAADELAEWSLLTAAVTDELGTRAAIGWESSSGPPPGRTVPVDITGRVDDGVYDLVRDGRAGESTRQVIGEQLLNVTGYGPLSKVDRTPVTLQLDTEHRLTQGQIANRAFTLAGLQASKINISGAIGSPRTKAVDLVEESPVEIARGALRSVGYALRENGEIAEAVPRPPDRNAARRLVISIKDLETLEISSISDVPEIICIEGSRPEIPGGGDGEVTAPPIVVEEYENRGILQAQFQQSTGGVLISTGLAEESPASLRLVRRVTTLKTTRNGCLIREEIITEAMHRRKAYRYTLDTDGSILAYNTTTAWIYDAGALAGDQSEAYIDRTEVFREVSRQVTRYIYDDVTKELTDIEVRESRYENPDAAVQSRSATTESWESGNWISGQRIEASGRGVLFPEDRYFDGPLRANQLGTGSTPITQIWASATDTEIASDNGYVASETDRTYGLIPFTESPGWRYRYADGTESEAADLLQGQIAGEARIYTVDQAGGATQTTITTGARDILIGATTEGIENGAPAVRRCDEDDERRITLQPIEGCHEGEGQGTVTETDDWVETADEAAARAERDWRELAALPATATLAFLPAVLPWDPIRIVAPAYGILRDGWVHSVEHALEAGEPSPRIVTNLELRLEDIDGS